MYYVYILKSKKFTKTYIGITDDPERRLYQHNQGHNYYTKRYRPWILLYKEQQANRTEARKREKYLKSATGRKWIKKIFFER